MNRTRSSTSRIVRPITYAFGRKRASLCSRRMSANRKAGIQNRVSTDSKVPGAWRKNKAQNLTLPPQPDWEDIWAIAAYSDGFIIVAKGYRANHRDVWHDGIYFLAKAGDVLQKVKVRGCRVIHDVIVREGVATWLCRSRNGKWSLIETSSGRDNTSRTVDLPNKHSWLRLGTSGDTLLLVAADRIYRDGGDNWDTAFKSNSPCTIYQRRRIGAKDCQSVRYCMRVARCTSLGTRG